MAPSATSTEWDHQFHTLRRQDLFRNPPTDHSAYPALQLAVNPHIESFNAIFRGDGKPGLLAHGLADIGTKVFLDGNDRADPEGRNRLNIRIKDVTLQKPQVPPSNKLALNREIFPAECRERHATYRGKLSATFEYNINGGDNIEFTRELGQVPIMIKVGSSPSHFHHKLSSFAYKAQTVKPMSSREQFARLAGPAQGRIRRAWWILHCQR